MKTATGVQASTAEGRTALLDMIVGKWLAHAIGVAAELGVADVVSVSPRPAGEVAADTGASEDAVYRLLRALAGVGLFTEHEDRRFALTQMGMLLRKDVSGSLRDFARFVGHDVNGRPWSEFIHSVQTGKPSFDFVFGKPLFEYLAAQPHAAKLMNDAMTSLSVREAVAIANAYDFRDVAVVADVGGGQGLLLSELLKANSRMRGILFELPHVLDGARELLRKAGVEERCELVAGDFFASVPPGVDAYIIKRVIHNWDDERAPRILRACRKAMRPDSTVLVIEVIAGAANASRFATLLDLEMLAITQGGRERSEQEFRKLFELAELKLARVLCTDEPVSILEGTAA